MNIKGAHILLPEDLLREIDSLVGPRGRSSFLVETARQEFGGKSNSILWKV